VTGAAGFVGAEVVACLLDRGHEVVAVDRGKDGLARLASRRRGALDAVTLDLVDAESVRARLRHDRPEGLVHLAWYANPVDYLTGHANLTSLSATNTLVEEALAAGCRRVVATGSCTEYALRDRPLVESDPAEPRSLYSVCKVAAWQVARSLAFESGASIAWARLFHIHGPMEDPRRIIPWVAGQLRSGADVDLTDGSQVRDHLHVSDVAGALVTLLEAGATDVYNVSSGDPVTLRQVLEAVGDVVGGKSHLKFGARPHRSNETMYLVGDSSRLRALGWAPRFGLVDGLEDALRPRF
jgi:dTDP-6-deoxy-L-talose 4-dehydrogenase (NAD+)